MLFGKPAMRCANDKKGETNDAANGAAWAGGGKAKEKYDHADLHPENHTIHAA